MRWVCGSWVTGRQESVFRWNWIVWTTRLRETLQSDQSFEVMYHDLLLEDKKHFHSLVSHKRHETPDQSQMFWPGAEHHAQRSSELTHATSKQYTGGIGTRLQWWGPQTKGQLSTWNYSILMYNCTYEMCDLIPHDIYPYPETLSFLWCAVTSVTILISMTFWSSYCHPVITRCIFGDGKIWKIWRVQRRPTNAFRAANGRAMKCDR